MVVPQTGRRTPQGRVVRRFIDPFWIWFVWPGGQRRDQMGSLVYVAVSKYQITVSFCLYTTMVNLKPTVGKPCNEQRKIDNCMRETKTENHQKVQEFYLRTMLISL